jgi:hypothetical protein
VRDQWDTVSVELVSDGSDVADGTSGAERTVAVRVDPGSLDLDELVVQLMHGPLSPDGSFDETRMHAVDLVPSNDDPALYVGTFVPADSGPWGASARTLPHHFAMSSIFDTGLVAFG